MNKTFSFLGITLAIFIVLSSDAWSRGGGGGGGRGRGDFNQPERTPTPTPTPEPAPAPIQGTITDVTPFAVSIKAGPQTVTITFKVSNTTVITLDAKTVTIAALKPGMLVTITPNKDKVYADSVVATIPVVATPTPIPAPVATSSGPPPPPAATPSSYQGPTPPPFGRQFVP